MASTTFVDYQKPAIGAAWLNDINNYVYTNIQGVANVKLYGAIGNGATDDTAAIQRALNSGAGRVYLPNGNYRITSTLTIPNNTILSGDGYASTLTGVGVVGPVLRMGPGGATSARKVRVENFHIGGSATRALEMDNCIGCSGVNIVADGTFTDAFYFNLVFPGHFSGFSTEGGTVSNACFWFANEVNACVFDNFYTSNLACQYNFFISGTGHGNTMNTPTAQGGRYGMYFQTTGFFGGWCINGLYEENTAHPITLGTTSTGVESVVFNGASLAGPNPTHPNYLECVAAIDIFQADGCVFSGIDFLGTLRTAGGYPTVTITGDGTGALGFARVKPTGEIHSIEVLTPGSGYTAATAVITGGGGSGAILSVSVGAGKVSSISVSNQGSGYKRPQTPMAVRYGVSTKTKFNAGRVGVPVLASNAPLYPMMVMNSAFVNNYLSSITIDDVSVINGSIGGDARVMKASGAANNKFVIVEYDQASGTQLTNIYSPLNYP